MDPLTRKRDHAFEEAFRRGAVAIMLALILDRCEAVADLIDDVNNHAQAERFRERLAGRAKE